MGAGVENNPLASLFSASIGCKIGGLVEEHHPPLPSPDHAVFKFNPPRRPSKNALGGPQLYWHDQIAETHRPNWLPNGWLRGAVELQAHLLRVEHLEGIQ